MSLSTTRNGIQLDIIKSGLQKYIRRCDFDKALFCALELDDYRQIKGGDKVFNNFVNRLRIILSEDILDKLVWHFQIYQWIDLYEIEKNVYKRIELLYNIIKAMCSLKKARMASYLRASYYQILQNPVLVQKYHINFTGSNANNLDNFVLLLGQRSYDCFYYFFQIFYHDKKNIQAVFDILGHILDKKLVDYYYKIYKTVCKNYPKPVFISFLILLCLNESLLDDDDLIEFETLSPVFIESLLVSQCSFELDDYVVDKHTATGRAKGKTAADFSLQGAIVNNQSSLVIDKFREMYNDVRSYQK
jgi:hypothetical protein